ncbi:MAG: protein kinase domain-containing protein, partial [Candidatus Acidiferrum sp.]
IKVPYMQFERDVVFHNRFEREEAVGKRLSHPKIIRVLTPQRKSRMYIAMEYVEGVSLRAIMRESPKMAPARALGLAQQLGEALEYMHGQGVIHRDLKPENIFITNEGLVKILDFGLAKLTQPEGAPARSQAMTADAVTDPGTVLGTMGYMSPEQVRGQVADARSDIFSFGAILYEMLSGKRAFHGATAADTLSSILKDDPPELTETNRNISPALERIVRHCLEKNPAQRFHSARDVAFDLESMSGSSSTVAMKATQAAQRRYMRTALLLAGLAAVVAGTFYAGRMMGVKSGHSAPPDIHQLTFRNGTVHSARFAPDGQTAVYSAAWEGKAEEIFTTSAQSPESRSLELRDAELLAISSSGQMALKLQPRGEGNFARPGTLATMPLTGGAPRAVLDNVESADWSPDGSQMAVVQYSGGQFSLQYPVGKVLFQAPLWISHLRVSPSGEQVAFLNHPFGGDEGSVMVVDKAGKAKELSSGWLTLQGLAWSPDGREIWFTGTRYGANRALYADSLDGKERMVERVPGMLTLQDISPQGQLLMTHAYERFV